jgi:hypothetical protein
MSEGKSAGAQCVYGHPCFAVCSNPACRKPGLICEAGFLKKEECCLFHEGCSRVKWS